MNTTIFRNTTHWTIGPFDIYGDWSHQKAFPPFDGEYMPGALTITAAYQRRPLKEIRRKWKRVISWTSFFTGIRLTLWQYPGKRPQRNTSRIWRRILQRGLDWPYCCGAQLGGRGEPHDLLIVFEYRGAPPKGSYYKDGIGLYPPKINDSRLPIIYKEGGFRYHEG